MPDGTRDLAALMGQADDRFEIPPPGTQPLEEPQPVAEEFTELELSDDLSSVEIEGSADVLVVDVVHHPAVAALLHADVVRSRVHGDHHTHSGLLNSVSRASRATATARDAEDGPLDVTWSVVLVHCSGGYCHDHPGESRE